MSSTDERRKYATATAFARVFALVVLAPQVALSGSYGALLSVILIAAVFMGATFTDGTRRIPVMPALVVEASLVTYLASLALNDTVSLLPALVIPLFVGGLVRGTRGAFEVLGAEVAVVAAATIPNGTLQGSPSPAGPIFTWLMAGLGFGLIAAFVKRARAEGSDTNDSYRDARRLITQLLELSDDLVDGLDPVSISQNILDLTREELSLVGAVVYVPTEHGIVPLLEGDVAGDDLDNSELVVQVLESGQAATGGPWAAFPLTTEAGVVAVVVGGLSPTARPPQPELFAAMERLRRTLRPEALRLDTALLFSAVREEATAEERRRLARDLHDGVAQDIASLGYLIDDLTESADSPALREQSQNLRNELSKVVAELRRSVFVLRNEADRSATLGESIRALAAHIESRSGIRVEVDLDEGSARLRPGVEAELLRIAQEGMNNAVRHAHAHLIVVRCRVHAPAAQIEVIDDGRGLQPGRDDSHGLRIMRERARRVGAELYLGNRQDRAGTQLRVTLKTAQRSEGPGPKMEGLAS